MSINSRKNLLSSNWFIIGGLIFLSLVPSIGGTVRLTQLATSADVTPERFAASPIPVVIHIFSVTFYAILGAFQFAPKFRYQQRNWHKLSGRFLVICGITVALSGLWMTHFYPWPEFDGQLLYVMRLAVGFGMLFSIAIAMLAIRERNFKKHGAWMIRAYALALGAGTQVFSHIPWFVFSELQGELFRAICMGAGWLINIVIAEIIIRTKINPPKRDLTFKTQLATSQLKEVL